MASVRPVYYDFANSLQEMSDDMLSALQSHAVGLFTSSPSVYLTRVDSGGNLDTITDTRYYTSIGTSDAVSVTRAENKIINDANITIQQRSINWENITQNIVTTNAPTALTHKFPLYYDGNHLKEMDIDDVYDTFISPISSTLSTAGSLYTILNTDEATGYTNLGKIFEDTIAVSKDDNGYSADNIVTNASQDIFNTTSYYLLQKNGFTISGLTRPVCFEDGHAVLFKDSQIDSLLKDSARHYFGNVSGNKLRFGWDINALFENDGTVTGTVLNRQLDNTGTDPFIGKRFSGNDYRAQEVPSGEPTTADTYRLKVRNDV
jgi:hypothetical protein